MKRRSPYAMILVWILLGTSLVAAEPVLSHAPVAVTSVAEGPGTPSPRVPSDFFTENAGQVANPDVLYYARGSGVSVGFAAGAVLVNLREPAPHDELDSRFRPMSPMAPPTTTPTAPLRGHLVRITFEGANPVLPQARGELPHRVNFFLGDDPARWHTNVRNYAEVVYEDAWDGIDVVYRPSPGGVKYDLIVHPRADLAVVAFAYEGVKDLVVTSGGLTAETSLGPVRDDLPTAWQASGRPVECTFRQIGERTVGYACAGWDGRGDLVIDPLVYATFLGGTTEDDSRTMGVDAFGNAIVGGFTRSVDFPTTPGAFDSSRNGSWDAFTSKIDASGSTLLFSTFVGGLQDDDLWGLAVDEAGSIYVTGTTNSSDFPVTPGGFQPDYAGGSRDAYVLKLDSAGRLMYATLLGGPNTDFGIAIAVDAAGRAHVAGTTWSPTFPTTPGAYDTIQNGGADAFVARVSPTGGTLEFSTFLGGATYDYSNSVDVDSGGNTYVIGLTDSADFPATPGVVGPSLRGTYDGFLAKLDGTGTTLVYGTFLGGTWYDGGTSVAVDADGNAFALGWTISADFPVTPGAYDTTLSGGGSFIAKVDPLGRAFVYATFLEAAANVDPGGIVVDAAGNAFVSGYTDATGFPTTANAFDRTCGTDGTCNYDGVRRYWDSYLTELNAAGDGLLYSTFLGGSKLDWGLSIAVERSGFVYVAGVTNSTDFPVTPGAFDTSYDGDCPGTGLCNVFVAKFDLRTTLNAPPILAWSGEVNYSADGLEPETGTTLTPFTYQVAYMDADADPPLSLSLRIEKPLGVAWGTFPMYQVDAWLGAPHNFTAGAVFTIALILSDIGADYWYSFNATDGRSWATGAPTIPLQAPIVVADRPPTALAVANPNETSMDLPITFDGGGSTDDFGIVAYRWDFGDGGTNTGPVVTHAYSSRGAFLVSLTVWDAAGQVGTDSLTIAVLNRVPTADAGPDQNDTKNSPVALIGTASSDPDVDPLLYNWTQSAGPVPVALTGPGTVTPSFTATIAGTYTFNLTVDDGLGGTDSDDVTVTVVNRAPTADAGPDQVGRLRNALVTLDGTGSSDPDGDSLTLYWTQTAGPAITLAGADTATPSFTPAAAGIYTFQLEVDDGCGGNATDTVSVTLINRAPIADAGANSTVLVGDLVTLNATASTDPDGDDLAYSWTVSPGGVTLSSTTVATPTFTPTAAGTWNFTLRVDDGSGGNDTATVTITVEAPPVPPPTAIDNTWLFVAAGIALLVLLVLLALFAVLKKRKPAEEEKDELIEQGETKRQP